MEWFILAVWGIVLLLIPTAYAGLIGAPWAPTRMAAVKRAFEDIGVGEKDVVIDLGAGDGAIIREAVARGATGIGYELSPIMWAIAKLRVLGKKRASIQYGNFLNKKLPNNTTVVFLFLMPKHMEKIRNYLVQQKLSPKTLVLSYAFPFPEMQSSRVYREKNCAPLYLYELSSLIDNSLR